MEISTQNGINVKSVDEYPNLFLMENENNSKKSSGDEDKTQNPKDKQKYRWNIVPF